MTGYVRMQRAGLAVAFLAALGMQDLRAARLQYTGQRVDVADVVIDDENLPAG